jgi:flavin reductase (DIM6/NTAB) family NADH-FMN oxidoreductase RutF
VEALVVLEAEVLEVIEHLDMDLVHLEVQLYQLLQELML